MWNIKLPNIRSYGSAYLCVEKLRNEVRGRRCIGMTVPVGKESKVMTQNQG